jgi:hypothetical protein
VSTSTYKQDPIKNIPNAKRVDPLSPPPGVVPSRKVDIVELDLNANETQDHFAEYMSADGKLYRFRTHDQKGAALAWRETLSLYLGVREMHLGGDPIKVFNAFRLSIKDLGGQQVYPIIDTKGSPITLG